jgi:microcystin-dependent protein
MSTPFIAEVRLVGFNFAPADWNFCNGQLLSISQYDALFALIGTTYGGDGQSTFGLPDLRGRIPIHQGSNGVSTYVMGQTGGLENVTITSNAYPLHSHVLSASPNPGTSGSPTGNVAGGLSNAYSASAPSTSLPMNATVLGSAQGSGQPHSNLQPYLTLNWVISLFGVFPSQN